MYKEIVNNTFNSVFENKYILMKALVVPFLLLLSLEYLRLEFATTSFLSFMFFAFIVFVNISIAITSHRILLLGENAVPTWGSLNLTSREMKFFAYSVALVLIALFYIIVVSLLVGFFFGDLGKEDLFLILGLIGVFSLIATYFFSRLSLVFPAVSVDENVDLSDSWEYTKKYKFLSFFCIVVFPIIIALVISFVYGLVLKFLSGLLSMNLSFLYALLNLFITVLMISTLSATYKSIMARVIPHKKESDISEHRILVYDNEGNFKITIPTSFAVTFEELKEELYNQYNQLGFLDIVIDKENKWMLKNPTKIEAYISLSYENGEFKIESYNVEKPVLSVLNDEIV